MKLKTKIKTPYIKKFVLESNLSVKILEKYLVGMVKQYENMPNPRNNFMDIRREKNLIYEKIQQIQKDIKQLNNNLN